MKTLLQRTGFLPVDTFDVVVNADGQSFSAAQAAASEYFASIRR